MPIKKLQRITSWSISRYTTYEECPYKAKLKFIERRKEPGGKAMERGSDIHKLAENAVLEKRSKIPPELNRFATELREARKIKGVEVELELAYDSNWDPCESTDWDRAWCRIKIDLLIPNDKTKSIDVIDHKTGRQKPTYTPQLELYALGGLLRYPQARTARARLWYLDQGIISPERKSEGIYQQSEVPKLKKLWEQRIVPMMTDTRFAPKPGSYCSFCHFRRSNGGPCKF